MTCARCQPPTCADCGTATYTQGAPVPGQRRRSGRGLCVTCYMRHHRAGTLTRFPRTVWGTGRGTTCGRCGIDGASDPCGDCRLD